MLNRSVSLLTAKSPTISPFSLSGVHIIVNTRIRNTCMHIIAYCILFSSALTGPWGSTPCLAHSFYCWNLLCCNQKKFTASTSHLPSAQRPFCWDHLHQCRGSGKTCKSWRTYRSTHSNWGQWCQRNSKTCQKRIQGIQSSWFSLAKWSRWAPSQRWEEAAPFSLPRWWDARLECHRENGDWHTQTLLQVWHWCCRRSRITGLGKRFASGRLSCPWWQALQGEDAPSDRNLGMPHHNMHHNYLGLHCSPLCCQYRTVPNVCIFTQCSSTDEETHPKAEVGNHHKGYPWYSTN